MNIPSPIYCYSIQKYSMMRFQNYQVLNNSTFELIEKDKSYRKYLSRIQNIVNRKYEQDKSPDQHMKNLRLKKQLARKQSLYESNQKIKIENASLFNKILVEQKRNFMKSDHQTVDMSLLRRKELAKINQENKEMGLRLAKAYDAKKKKKCAPEIAKHKGNVSIYLKYRKLPLLIEDKDRKEEDARLREKSVRKTISLTKMRATSESKKE